MKRHPEVINILHIANIHQKASLTVTFLQVIKVTNIHHIANVRLIVNPDLAVTTPAIKEKNILQTTNSRQKKNLKAIIIPETGVKNIHQLNHTS